MRCRCWLKISLRLRIGATDKPNAVHLDSPSGATLMLLTACAMDWRQNIIPRVVITNNPGPILGHLWTKVREILRPCRGSHILFNSFARFSMFCFFDKNSPLSHEVIRKPNKCESFLCRPIFGSEHPDFYDIF